MNFLPGWHSIESTTWFHDLFEKSSIVMLCLLALAIGLAYIYGHRRDYLSDTAIHEALQRAAVAEKQAAIAERQSTTPERRTTVAQEPVEIPEKRPAIPEEQKSTADRQIPVVESQAPAAKTEPLQSDPELHRVGQTAPTKKPFAEKKSALDIERKKSNAVSTPRIPRHLVADQATRLRDFLARQPKGRLTIKVNPSVPDAPNYGVELAQFFRREAGWQVRIDSSVFLGPDYGGMWLTLQSADAIPEFTGTLHAALAHARIPVRDRPVWDPNGPSLNEIWLVIGK